MQWIFRGWYDIWAEAVWEALGQRKVFLVEIRLGANKHRYKIVGNCLKMINIVTGCGFARGHKREKKIQMKNTFGQTNGIWTWVI